MPGIHPLPQRERGRVTEVTRVFPVSVILSVYHNRLMCSFGEMREFLNFMTRHDVALWEIPRARALSAQHLSRQYPWLKKYEPPAGFKNDAMHSGRFVRGGEKLAKSKELSVLSMGPGEFVPHGPHQGEAYADWSEEERAQ